MLLTDSFIAAPTGTPRNFPTPRPTQAPRPTAAAVFNLILEQYQAKGMSRGGAMRQAVKDHPAAHAAWLREINT